MLGDSLASLVRFEVGGRPGFPRGLWQGHAALMALVLKVALKKCKQTSSFFEILKQNDDFFERATLFSIPGLPHKMLAKNGKIRRKPEPFSASPGAFCCPQTGKQTCVAAVADFRWARNSNLKHFIPYYESCHDLAVIRNCRNPTPTP